MSSLIYDLNEKAEEVKSQIEDYERRLFHLRHEFFEINSQLKMLRSFQPNIGDKYILRCGNTSSVVKVVDKGVYTEQESPDLLDSDIAFIRLLPDGSYSKVEWLRGAYFKENSQSLDSL